MITAAPALGDVAFAVSPPGRDEPVLDVDEGGGGVFGLDAEAAFTATESGPHDLDVPQVDGISTDCRVTVEPA